MCVRACVCVYVRMYVCVYLDECVCMYVNGWVLVYAFVNLLSFNYRVTKIKVQSSIDNYSN